MYRVTPWVWVWAILACFIFTTLMCTNARAQECELYTITAYSVEQFPGRTADGTSTSQSMAKEHYIAAASYNVPFDAIVAVDSVGSYRVADRGSLGNRQIDILVATTQEALEFGRQQRRVCVYQ